MLQSKNQIIINSNKELKQYDYSKVFRNDSNYRDLADEITHWNNDVFDSTILKFENDADDEAEDEFGRSFNLLTLVYLAVKEPTRFSLYEDEILQTPSKKTARQIKYHVQYGSKAQKMSWRLFQPTKQYESLERKRESSNQVESLLCAPAKERYSSVFAKNWDLIDQCDINSFPSNFDSKIQTIDIDNISISEVLNRSCRSSKFHASVSSNLSNHSDPNEKDDYFIEINDSMNRLRF